MNALVPRRARGEDGVTIMELLLVMLISAVIFVPIAASIFLGLRANADTQTRLEESNGAGLLSSYFVPDVQNAYDVRTNAPESADCGGITGTVLVLLAAPDGSSVSYFVDPADPSILRRRECFNGAPVGSSIGIAIAHRVVGTPTFACANPPSCTSWSASLTQNDKAGRMPYHTMIQGTKKVR